MNTISVISSISWNSPEFFEAVIGRLHDAGLIDWCHWIEHKPEKDEAKSHIHFVLQPSRRIDTNSLAKEFVEPVNSPAEIKRLYKLYQARGEIVPVELVKPRGVNPFRKTNGITDWFLYALHDINYLMKKGQTRQYHYSRSDIQSTHPDFVDEQMEDCVSPISVILSRVIEMRDAGYTFGTILTSGLIPANMAWMAKVAYDDGQKLDRNGRSGHAENPQF